ncbi:TPA: hypothetical protein SL382_004431 [Pseudomonas aeruginosa]|nr:hypothetical protein [Pseudomonas aeruginosa]
MSQPPIDYQISAADAHELAGAVLLPADLRRPVRTCVGHAKAMKQDATK